MHIKTTARCSKYSFTLLVTWITGLAVGMFTAYYLNANQPLGNIFHLPAQSIWSSFLCGIFPLGLTFVFIYYRCDLLLHLLCLLKACLYGFCLLYISYIYYGSQWYTGGFYMLGQSACCILMYLCCLQNFIILSDFKKNCAIYTASFLIVFIIEHFLVFTI